MRRAAVEMCIQGKDVSLDLAPHLLSLSYVDKADDELDDLQVSLEDREGLWQGDWLPAHGDTVSVVIVARGFRAGSEEEELDCGDFEKVLKGLLSEKKFSFTDCPDEADWSVSVDIDTREYGVSEIGGMKIYTVYAEASLTMRKIIGTQKTLEDRVSAKGVHTVGYEEALRDAFDKLGDTLAERLYSIINQ